MIDLNKYSGPDKSRILHSSGAAQVGQGARIGSAGGLSFQRRLEVAERNRTVGDYRRSAIGAQRGSLRVRRAATPDASLPGQQSSVSAPNPTSQPGFKEPPSRGYNPYA